MKRAHDGTSGGEPPAKQSKKEAALSTEEENLMVNTLRCLSADQPTQAKSGHPGAPLGCAPMAHVLFTRHMRFNPANPRWPARDRFVLSNGHASALLYSMLHLTGYDVSMQDLKAFRQVGSITPGHPERGVTPGVEVTTGPLGQGLSNAVGMAIAEAHQAAHFNRPGFEIVRNNVFVICGDGCLQEGVTQEAASLAGHLKLGRLVVLFDSNSITIDGSTDISFTEDTVARFAAYGWHTQTVANGDTDLDAIDKAVAVAKEDPRPSFIAVTTTIGYRSVKQGTAGVHGSPLTADDLKQLKRGFGLDPEETFQVSAPVAAAYGRQREVGAAEEAAWSKLFEGYKAAHPELAAEFTRRHAGDLPEGWEAVLPAYSPSDPPAATRALSGKVLNAVAPVLPELMGGSADLSPSTKTELACSHDFAPGRYDGRYVRYGVREHAMCAVNNGIHAYGGQVPFGATFLVFLTYCDASVRLAALANHQALYIFTHDSIALGEDGPTHQPVEVLQIARSHPNLLVLRPADGNETAGAYLAALRRRDGPSLLALTRQNVPHLAGSSRDKVLQGGYVLQEAPNGAPEVVLVASGSEVSLCVEAVKKGLNARVVSMPCMELFEEQSAEYKQSVFPTGVPSVSVEMSLPLGWEKYAHAHVCITTYGHSGPAGTLVKEYGFTPENVVEKAQQVVQHYKGRPAPALFDRFVFSSAPSHPQPMDH
mmetsp:Transcript_22739/g.63924  ORF Transcript_22739/g.63924 Transcript_22739/m.63924 type:complete len:707 (-) Transcript_22739:33-2153(-)